MTERQNWADLLQQWHLKSSESEIEMWGVQDRQLKSVCLETLVSCDISFSGL
jgi:hypothetical protein